MTIEEPVYRPPWEARSILVPVTQSCNWNRCKFCYRSKDYKFKVATPEQFRSDLIEAARFHPLNAPVFFVGSNNFALPAHRLLEFISIVDEELPNHGRISMFSRVDAIARKADEELKELAKRECAHLYVGTENGNDEALELMDKGHTSEQAVEQLQRLDKAGIKYTVFYILGLGGKGAGEKSGKETAQLLNQLNPERIVTTGMTVTEGTGAWDMFQTGEYEKASEREMIEELRTFLQTLEIGSFYDGAHALNPVHFRFDTSDQEVKAQVLAEIEKVLARYSDGELEAAINRRFLEESCKPIHAA